MPPKKIQGRRPQGVPAHLVTPGWTRIKPTGLAPGEYSADCKWSRKVRIDEVIAVGTDLQITFAKIKAAIGVNSFTRVNVHRIDAWLVAATKADDVFVPANFQELRVLTYLPSGTGSQSHKEFTSRGLSGAQCAHVAVIAGKANPPFQTDGTVILGVFAAPVTISVVIDLHVALFDTNVAIRTMSDPTFDRAEEDANRCAYCRNCRCNFDADRGSQLGWSQDDPSMPD